MYKFNLLDKISFILVMVGALNWGLIGLCNLNLVVITLGNLSDFIGRIIYILIGVSAINLLLVIFKMKRSYKS